MLNIFRGMLKVKLCAKKKLTGMDAFCENITIFVKYVFMTSEPDY